jgi:four helix bundle protein
MKLIKAEYLQVGQPGKRGFEDLECYKLALDLLANAHKVATSLPAEEKYDLVQQLRRASKSVSANIAEGYGRFHYLETLRFYSIARGSLNETLNHLITANTLGYIANEEFKALYELCRSVERTLNGLMKYVRDQKRGADVLPSGLREELADYEVDLDTYFQPD